MQAVPRVRDDFAKGQNGAILIEGEDLKALDELTFSGLDLVKSSVDEQLEIASEQLMNLVGK